MSMFGCGTPKFNVDAGSGYELAKKSYAAGEEVTAYYPYIATDTDYTFYVEEEDVEYKTSYDNEHGYVLTFICEKDLQEKVKNIILGLNKDIKVISNKGGNLIFSAGLDKIKELGWFIKILNRDFSDDNIKDLKGLVKECGIEQTSIEEIFLKIAKEEGEDINDDEIENVERE